MSHWTQLFTPRELSGKAPIQNRSFEGVDLSGAELDGVILTNCNFRNAILQKAELNGAKLFGCDFDGVDASHFEATGTSFDDMTWRAGRAVGAHFGKSTFTNVDLCESDLSGAILRGADIWKSKLTRAKLVGADLQRRARFTECDLRGIDIDGVVFGATELVDCAVHGITGLPKEPHDLSVIRADFSADAGGSRLGGLAELTAHWQTTRR